MLIQLKRIFLPLFFLLFVAFGLLLILFEAFTLPVQAQGLSRPFLAAKPPTAVFSSTAPVSQTDDVIARVNGVVIDAQTWQTAVAIDRTMSQLLGQPAQSDAAMLDMLVNGELVRQTMDAAFTVPDADVSAVVQQLLARSGRSQEALAAQLAAQGVGWSDFETHVADLLRVERFVQQQSAAAQRAPDAYVAQLQAAAQISFGDAVQLAAVTAVPPPPVSAVAASAPVAVPPLSTAVSNPAAAAKPAPPPDAAANEAPGAVLSLAALNAPDNADSLTLAHFQGQPTLVSFWTTWCPYCRAQTPVLVAEYGRFAAQGIQFVGVNVREAENIVRPYVADAQIPYPVLLDENGELAAVFQVTGYPTTILLDAKGQIIGRHVGQLSETDLDRLLAPFLSDS